MQPCGLAHRGTKMGLNRGRATTRVAPTKGLAGPIFVPMTVVGVMQKSFASHAIRGRDESMSAPVLRSDL